MRHGAAAYCKHRLDALDEFLTEIYFVIALWYSGEL